MSNYLPLEPIFVTAILKLAKAHAKASKWLLSTVSRRAHGDPLTFDGMNEGRISPSIRKLDVSIAWLLDPANWPEGATIPEVYLPWQPQSKGVFNGKKARKATKERRANAGAINGGNATGQ